jgi:hypothetical protein
MLATAVMQQVSVQHQGSSRMASLDEVIGSRRWLKLWWFRRAYWFIVMRRHGGSTASAWSLFAFLQYLGFWWELY